MEVMTGKIQAIAVRRAQTMELIRANLKINHFWSPLFSYRGCEILCKIFNQDSRTGSCDETVNLWGTSCWLGRTLPVQFSQTLVSLWPVCSLGVTWRYVGHSHIVEMLMVTQLVIKFTQFTKYTPLSTAEVE
jgi:hypothetical protein